MARPLKWQQFTKEWRSVLRPTGIKVFHATDCNGLRGEFRGWTKEKRDKLVALLLPIIPRYAFGSAVTVKLIDVEKALTARPELRKFHRDPYGMCLQWVLTSVVRRIDELPNPRPVAVVHEINAFHESATLAFNHVRDSESGGKHLRSLTFGAKDEYVPLQAADILAYEASRSVLYQDGPRRRSFDAIIGNGVIDHKSFNRNNIDLYVEMLGTLKAAYDAGILADGWKYDVPSR